MAEYIYSCNAQPPWEEPHYFSSYVPFKDVRINNKLFVKKCVYKDLCILLDIENIFCD